MSISKAITSTVVIVVTPGYTQVYWSVCLVNVFISATFGTHKDIYHASRKWFSNTNITWKKLVFTDPETCPVPLYLSAVLSSMCRCKLHVCAALVRIGCTVEHIFTETVHCNFPWIDDLFTILMSCFVPYLWVTELSPESRNAAARGRRAPLQMNTSLWSEVAHFCCRGVGFYQSVSSLPKAFQETFWTAI